MKRGFKAEAERRALGARTQLGLGANDLLDPWKYAEFLDVHVLSIDDLDLDAKHRAQLVEHDADSWSGMTLMEDGITQIVLNSAHARTRQTSTLMHELAHILLEHLPSSVNVSPSGYVLLSDYSDDQEQEADWLGAALLLPESALLHHRSRGLSIREVASIFGVSYDLCAWRCRMAGVEKRLLYKSRPAQAS